MAKLEIKINDSLVYSKDVDTKLEVLIDGKSIYNFQTQLPPVPGKIVFPERTLFLKHPSDKIRNGYVSNPKQLTGSIGSVAPGTIIPVSFDPSTKPSSRSGQIVVKAYNQQVRMKKFIYEKSSGNLIYSSPNYNVGLSLSETIKDENFQNKIYFFEIINDGLGDGKGGNIDIWVHLY